MNKGGRPRREGWQVARGIAWAYAVAELSNKRIKLSQPDSFWSRYRSGEISPSPRQVTLAEIEVPESRTYFDSSLWRLTDSQTLGKHSQRELFNLLVPALRERWVYRDFQSLPFFWRKQTKVGQELRDILEFFNENRSKYLESLLAMSVLLHEAVLRQDRERLEAVLEVWTAAIRYAANQENDVCGFVNEDVSSHLAQFGRNVATMCRSHQ